MAVVGDFVTQICHLRLQRSGLGSIRDVGSNLVRYFLDNPAFSSLRDLSFDLDAGYFFLVDSDGNDSNGIIRGNIADLFTGRADPDWERDRELLDQAPANPWEPPR